METLCPFGSLSPRNFKKLSTAPHPSHMSGKTGTKCHDLLKEANEYFSKKIYPESIVPLLQSEMDLPSVLVWGHSLFLITSRRRETVDIVPPIYEELKFISHIPLSLFLLVVPVVYPFRKTQPLLEVSLNNEVISQVKAYAAILEDIPKVLHQQFTGETLAHQKEIINLCLKFIELVTKKQKTISFDELLSFTKSTTPYLQNNIKTGTRALLDCMHTRMMMWKETLTDFEWNNMRVVVAGGPMARKMELHMQYFAKLLNTDMESKRVMYAEHASNMNDLVLLLGIHTTDFSIGDAFFGNEEFMHHDIQASDCQEYLHEIFKD